MINIGICDDEAPMRRLLRAPLEQKLQLLGEDYRIFEYDCGETLVTRPETEWLDILFLDIEMKQLNGMETVRNILSGIFPDREYMIGERYGHHICYILYRQYI